MRLSQKSYLTDLSRVVPISVGTKRGLVPRRSFSGFSLMEMIIYLAIISLVMVSMVSFALVISSSHDKALAAGEVEANLRLISSEISRQIKSARSFNLADSILDNDQGRLSLWLDQAATQAVAIDLDQGKVRLQFGLNPALTLSDSRVTVKRLRFEQLSATEIKVSLFVAFGTEASVLPAAQNYEQEINFIVKRR